MLINKTMFDLNAKLVCVDDKFPAGIHDVFNALPVKDKVYTVGDIVPGQTFDMKGTCAVLLNELPNRPNKHGIEPGFVCGRFREIQPDEQENLKAVNSQEVAV